MGEKLPESVPTQTTETAESPEIRAFIEGIRKADGTLYPLKKKTQDGKSLYIAARYVRSPATDPGGNADSRFRGWHDAHLINAVLLIDVYAQDEEDLVPVGHRDWLINGAYASGGEKVRNAVLPRKAYEQKARDKWSQNTESFEVQGSYQRQNIGSLMFATSAIALPALGIRCFQSGMLLPPGERTYRRFGLSETDFYKPQQMPTYLPIEQLAQHPTVMKILSEFIS